MDVCLKPTHMQKYIDMHDIHLAPRIQPQFRLVTLYTWLLLNYVASLENHLANKSFKIIKKMFLGLNYQ